jgi:hypothetical protein
MITLEDQKKAAVGMWNFIIEKINSTPDDERHLHTWKSLYVEKLSENKELYEHVRNWESLCLFCHIYKFRCIKCPLKSCDGNSGSSNLWEIVCDGEKEEAVNAAKQIIEKILEYRGVEDDGE